MIYIFKKENFLNNTYNFVYFFPLLSNLLLLQVIFKANIKSKCLFEAVLIFLVPLLPEMQMGKKRPVRCNQNADISQQWWEKKLKWQKQVDWMNRWKNSLLEVKCLSQGNINERHSLRQMKTSRCNENDFMTSTHNQMSDISQQWYNLNDGNKWLWTWNRWKWCNKTFNQNVWRTKVMVENFKWWGQVNSVKMINITWNSAVWLNKLITLIFIQTKTTCERKHWFNETTLIWRHMIAKCQMKTNDDQGRWIHVNFSVSK